jgi:hypothetical protein
LESPAGVLVKKVSIMPVTESFTSLRSDGNRLPICASTAEARTQMQTMQNKKNFFFIDQLMHPHY